MGDCGLLHLAVKPQSVLVPAVDPLHAHLTHEDHELDGSVPGERTEATPPVGDSDHLGKTWLTRPHALIIWFTGLLAVVLPRDAAHQVGERDPEPIAASLADAVVKQLSSRPDKGAAKCVL